MLVQRNAIKMKKTLIFIGNRKNVLVKLLEMTDKYSLSIILVLEDSPLHLFLKQSDLKYTLFKENKTDKGIIFNLISESHFDILVSNGCPFILPITNLKENHPNALFINTHPTYLPHLKGRTPLNGVFYLNYNFIGATTHYMDDGIDTGNIIFQSKIDLTPDIDQGLIYFISFYLEGQVFECAMKNLETHNFNFQGITQIEEGTYFNREEKKFILDFRTDLNESMIKKVKSLGVDNQGICLNIESNRYTVFEASEITNTYLLKIFKTKNPGDILIKYNNKIIVKTIESAINFSYFK